MPPTQDQVIEALTAVANETYNGVTSKQIKAEIVLLQKGEQVSVIGKIVESALDSIGWAPSQFDAHTLVDEDDEGLIQHHDGEDDSDTRLMVEPEQEEDEEFELDEDEDDS